MNTLHDQTVDEVYSAKNSIKPVDFYCPAHAAKTVHLTGDFNHWHPTPMEQRVGGCWFIQMWLPHGSHRYRFLVDGQPVLDLNAAGTARDERDGPVSLITVS